MAATGTAADERAAGLLSPEYVDATSARLAHGRRDVADIEYVVLMDVGDERTETLGEAIRALEALGPGTATHFVIDRAGLVAQCVPLDQKAHDPKWEPDSRPYEGGKQAVYVALVHDEADGGYPEDQLEGLDRLLGRIGDVSRGMPLGVSGYGDSPTPEFPYEDYRLLGHHVPVLDEARRRELKARTIRGHLHAINDHSSREGTYPVIWHDEARSPGGAWEEEQATGGSPLTREQIEARLAELEPTKAGFARREFVPEEFAGGADGWYGPRITEVDGSYGEVFGVTCQECGRQMRIATTSKVGSGLGEYAQTASEFRRRGYEARIVFLCDECGGKGLYSFERALFASDTMMFLSVRLPGEDGWTLTPICQMLPLSRDLAALRMVLAFLDGAASYEELNADYGLCDSLCPTADGFEQAIRRVLLGDAYRGRAGLRARGGEGETDGNADETA